MDEVAAAPAMDAVPVDAVPVDETATMEAPTYNLPLAANSWDGYIALVYGITIPLLVAIAVFAIWLSTRWFKRNKTQEDFITARRQVSTIRLAWTFFAGAVGAWVIASPASYATYAGTIGLVFYALASGFPVLITAFAGSAINNKMPHVQSLTDFMGWRYGWIAKTFVMLVCIFNMSIALLAEYSTIGSLYQYYLGSVDYPIILVVGFLTMAYTATGGLLISVITDQIQGALAMILSFICAMYLAAKFREPLTEPMPDYIAGTNVYGYSAIFVMPLSLSTATVFSEAMWQRAWAADSNKNLQIAAGMGAIAITIVVFIFGLMGLLANWAGLIPFETANANLYAFYGLVGSINDAGTINNWVGVVVLILASVMNMGAVDSLQNGLSAALSSHIFKYGVPWEKKLSSWPESWWKTFLLDKLMLTRVFVFIINVPLIVATVVKSAQGEPLEVLSLFLITNMICTCCAFPVLAGLFHDIEPYYGGISMLLSCLIAFVCTSWYGIAECWNDMVVYDEFTFTYSCQPDVNGTTNSFSSGMTFTWYRNGYQWDYFLVAACTSIGAIALLVGFHYTMQQLGREQKKELFGFRPESKSHMELAGSASNAVAAVDDVKKASTDDSEGSTSSQ